MKKAVRMIIDVLAIIFLLFLDQFTKYLAITDLKDQPAVVLIDGILELQYLENKGAAFGMLQNKNIIYIYDCCHAYSSILCVF